MRPFDPYRQWLRIPPDRRPPTYYDLLGLPTDETDERRIHQAAQDRYDHVRKYARGPLGEQRDEALRVLGELSDALACLTHPARRREYDRRLQAGKQGSAAGAGGAVHDVQDSMRSLLDEELGPADAADARTARLALRPCPHCGHYLIPSAVLCVRCGTDFRTGEKLTTVVVAQPGTPTTSPRPEAPWSRLGEAVDPPEHKKPGATLAVWAMASVGVVLVVSIWLGVWVYRSVVHYRMDGIVFDLQLGVARTRIEKRDIGGYDGKVASAAQRFARYLPYAPAYFATLESGDSRAASKKRYLVREIIRNLPPGTDLTPLGEVPPDSFAYEAVQARLEREDQDR